MQIGMVAHNKSSKYFVVRSGIIFVLLLAAFFVSMCVMPGKAFAEKKVHLQDGQTFDLSQVKNATRVYVDTSGTFRFVGSSTKVVVDVAISEGENATVIFDDATIRPDGTIQGFYYNDCSAIVVKDTKKGGGEVSFVSAPGSLSRIEGYGDKPAIQKSGTKTKLIFKTEDPSYPGTIEARADSTSFRTCAIGAYGSHIKKIMNTAGNIVFESGNIEAYGSPGGGAGTSGGAGIGADAGAYVDGITIKGGNVTAVAGDGSAAAIGTSSADVSYLVVPWIFDVPIAPRDAKNISIEGGTVTAEHADGSGGSGGAGIGGGYGCSADGITISGGTVNAEGSTGIGGGSNGDGLNIKITGGKVTARGQFTGIGGGKSTGTVTSNAETWFGEATVDISGGQVEAYCVGEAEGVGIGGWKSCVVGAENLNGRGHVSISGGEVNARGANGLPGIGTGTCGSLSYISISGGHVYAKGGTWDGDLTAPGIGMRENMPSFSQIKRISISGGTVEAVAGGDTYSIGAFSNIDVLGKKTNAPIYISGGNVKALSGTNGAPKQSANGKEVSLCQVDTETYNRESTLADRTVSNLVVRDLSNGASETIPYGYNDMHPFKADSAATYYLWLPSCEEKSIEVRISPESAYMTNRDADFSGISKNATMRVCPRTQVTLVADPDRGEQGENGSVVFGQGLDPIDYKRTVREGKKLIGYSLSSDGSNMVLDAQGKLISSAVDSSGASFADAAGRFVGSSEERYKRLSLYAQWEDTGGVVQFDPNKPAGVSAPVFGDTTDKNVDAGNQLQLTNELSLAGYSFTGWNTKPDGSGEEHPIGDYVTITEIGEVVTLYAQWQRSEYLICFMPNGGELESGEASHSQRAFFGLDTSLDTPAMKLASCHLTGWNTDPDGTGEPYELGQNVRDIADADKEVVYLYAQWATDTYTVNYDGNGAEGEMDSDVLECGISHILPNRGYTYEGYTFTGWNTIPDGSGVSFPLGGSYSDLAIVGESITLYAQWQKDEPSPEPEPEPEPSPEPSDEPSDEPSNSDSQSEAKSYAKSESAKTADTMTGRQAIAGMAALLSAVVALVSFGIWRRAKKS